MAKLIGRRRETEILKSSLNDGKSNLIAIYGRRRVGKTFLIREFYKDHTIFEVTGKYNGEMGDQLEGFYKEISQRSKTKVQHSPKTTWSLAFYTLENYLDTLHSSTKKVIFLDEFPWMATPKSKFLMAFENFWNHYCTKRDDLIVVICGSAASYMTQKIIQNKGGLHNRITRQIRLLPFDLHETDLFLKSRGIDFSYYDTAQIYMTFGGVPHYLDKIEKGASVPQTIDQQCFEQGSPLSTEFDHLFQSLFKDSEIHLTIIKALAKTNYGITRKQLIEKCKIQSGGDFSLKLNELIESGFVSSYRYYGNKEQLKMYRLSDEYTKFYLKFIHPNRDLGFGTWQRLHESASFQSWLGFAFEVLCLKHIGQIKKILKIEGIYSVNSSWFNESAQIDLLIDRDDQVINLCEIKFYNGSLLIDQKYYQNLKNKIAALRGHTQTRKNIFLTMITTFGLKENSYSLELVQNNIQLSDLFSG